MGKKRNKLEHFGLTKTVRTLHKQGRSLEEITTEIKKLLPSGETISISTINYFLKHDKAEILFDESPIEKLKLLEKKVWSLSEDAESLLQEAKNHTTDNPLLFEKSIRSANEVLRTCLLLIKEMNQPARILSIDIKKQSLEYLLEFTSGLHKETKLDIQKHAESFVDNTDIN